MADKQFWNHAEKKSVKYTISDFEKQFPDDSTCLEWLYTFLYPEGIHCQKCNKVTKHHRVASRPSYSCDQCGHHVHPTAGTIFHKSTTPLRMWFRAIYLMASTRCGVSAKHLERELGVTYKTAWRMFKQIRSMLEEDVQFTGAPVEMDETYFGGERRGKRPDGKRNTGRPAPGDPKKTPIVGIVERKGKIVARATKDVKGSTLLGMIREYVLPKSMIFTDDASMYDGVKSIRDKSGNHAGYQHRRINHSAKVYVQGDIHTNQIEGFWSLVKRGIGGAHHAVSQKYLQTYLNEFQFRYNRRDAQYPMFLAFLAQIEKQERVKVEAASTEEAAGEVETA